MLRMLKMRAEASSVVIVGANWDCKVYYPPTGRGCDAEMVVEVTKLIVCCHRKSDRVAR